MLFSSENPTEINKRTQHSHFKWTHNTLVRMQSSALQGVNSKTTIQMISSSRGQGDNLLVEVPGSNRARADDTCKFTRQYGTNTQKCSGGVYWPTRILFFARLLPKHFAVQPIVSWLHLVPIHTFFISECVQNTCTTQITYVTILYCYGITKHELYCVGSQQWKMYGNVTMKKGCFVFFYYLHTIPRIEAGPRP